MCGADRMHASPAQADQAGSSAAGGPPPPLIWHGSSCDSSSLLQEASAAAAGLQHQLYYAGDGGTPLAGLSDAVLCAVPYSPSTVLVHERAALAAGWLK